MAVEIKEEIGRGVEAVEEQSVMGADLIAGATAAAVETLANPVRAARKLERKGAPINRRIRSAAAHQAEDAGEALQAYFPEQIVLRGLRLVKERARRKDLIGEMAFRALEIINGGLGTANTVVGRMERASTPPSRGSAKAPVQTSVREVRRSVRKTAGKTAGKTVKTATTQARGSARRASAAARRTERTATARTASASRRTTRPAASRSQRAGA